MPLSPSVPRKCLHRRAAHYEGFARDDGLFDVEGQLLDVKDHDFMLQTGLRRAGVPVHQMSVRVTIDHDFTIRAIEAKSDAVPYPGGCDSIEAAYGKLVGANLMQGFRKRLHDTMGGVAGCSHLTELIGCLPTAAVQMFAGMKRREDDSGHKPFQLDRCHALETTSEVVRQYYPRWYRGADRDSGSG